MLLFNFILIVSLFNPTYPPQEIYRDKEVYKENIVIPDEEPKWEIEEPKDDKER